jgi:phage shock protein A
MARNDLLGRLADISEEAMQRLSDAPGGERLMNTLNSMRDRVDELSKRVRGLEELEKRLEALERRVDKIAKDDGPSSGSGSSSKTTSTKSSGASSAKKP